MRSGIYRGYGVLGREFIRRDDSFMFGRDVSVEGQPWSLFVVKCCRTVPYLSNVSKYREDTADMEGHTESLHLDDGRKSLLLDSIFVKFNGDSFL